MFKTRLTRKTLNFIEKSELIKSVFIKKNNFLRNELDLIIVVFDRFLGEKKLKFVKNYHIKIILYSTEIDFLNLSIKKLSKLDHSRYEGFSCKFLSGKTGYMKSF